MAPGMPVDQRASVFLVAAVVIWPWHWWPATTRVSAALG
jgi:hypothetical protein